MNPSSSSSSADLHAELAALRHRLGELDEARLTLQRVLSQLRSRVWQMQQPEDIRGLIEGIGAGLRDLKVNFSDVGINLVDPYADQAIVLPHTLTDQGKWIEPTRAYAEDLLQRVWRSGEVCYRPDLEAEDRFDELDRARQLAGHPVRCVVDAPFSHGTLALNSDSPGAFSEEDIAVLQSVAEVLSEGYTRMGDLQDLARRAQEAESLASAIAVVGATANLAQVFDAVVVEATRMLDTERATLFIYDIQEAVLIPRAQVGHDWEVYREVRLRPGEDMSGTVFATRQPFLIGPAGEVTPHRRAENTVLFERAIQGKALSGGAAVPLLLRDEAIGTLSVGTARRQLTGRDVGLLERLAEQAVLAIDRARQADALEARNRELVGEISERKQREAQRTAHHRMREEVWQMRGEADIDGLLEALGQGLEALGVPYQGWGINVVDESVQPPRVHFHNRTRSGGVRGGQMTGQAGNRVVEMYRQGRPTYRPDLERHDEHGEADLVGAGFQHRACSLLDIPFSHGTLAVNSHEANAFTERDIANLVEVAEVLSEGFRRQEDLRLLADERERLAVTLGSIGDGVVATDPDGNTVLLNKAAEELTGWTQAEAMGRPLSAVFRIVNEDTLQACADPVSAVIRAGAAVDLPDRTALLSREGTQRSISDSGAPIRDREGRTIGVVLVFRDVTVERGREAEQLKTEKLESLGVLAGGIAHDFNNILTTVSGCISLAKLDLEPTDELFDTLTEVEEAAIRATRLTQQLLTFSRGGAPVKKMASIGEVVSESATFALRGSNVRCEYALAEDLWPLEIDTGQISQVVQNLVINGQQAMAGGGSVRVAIRNVTLARGARLPIEPGPYIEIKVADSGVGISRSHLQRIFDPYFTTKQAGSGLGLATVHSIVANHQGHIGVESEIGVGTTFTVLLPARPGAPGPEEGTEAAPPGGQGRILLMDDDEQLLKTARRMLERLGYEVSSAADGEAAVSAYRAAMEEGRPFAATILDLTIPGGKGGEETVRDLLEMDPETRAIASSGYSSAPIMAEYSEWGFKGAVAKPYDMGELARALSSALR